MKKQYKQHIKSLQLILKDLEEDHTLCWSDAKHMTSKSKKINEKTANDIQGKMDIVNKLIDYYGMKIKYLKKGK